MTDSPDKTSQKHKNRKTALYGVAVVIVMSVLAWAAIPLYRIFCQVTGYGGTTGVADQEAVSQDKGSETTSSHKITVRFDATVDKELPWDFYPVKKRMTVKIGEMQKAFYRAKNNSKQSITGMAVFNVTPHIAGEYFKKIDCFCFEEQTLEPGESADMPVTFFIDSSILENSETKNINVITLSYTFFNNPPD